jgi:hypothetical protein
MSDYDEPVTTTVDEPEKVVEETTSSPWGNAAPPKAPPGTPNWGAAAPPKEPPVTPNWGAAAPAATRRGKGTLFIILGIILLLLSACCFGSTLLYSFMSRHFYDNYGPQYQISPNGPGGEGFYYEYRNPPLNNNGCCPQCPNGDCGGEYGSQQGPRGYRYQNGPDILEYEDGPTFDYNSQGPGMHGYGYQFDEEMDQRLVIPEIPDGPELLQIP